MAVKLNVVKLKKFLREEKNDTVDLKQIVNLAEVLTDSMAALFQSCDSSVHKDLQAIAAQITDTKKDLAKFRAVEMEKHHIPGAGLELDAVVEATENATETIMGAAEEIMCADSSDTDAYVALVNDKMIEIFEACSFQDITGQRISKVVQLLADIDSQIENLLSHFDTEGEVESEIEVNCHRDQEVADGLLNGPQSADKAVQQDDIDVMFN